MPAEYKPLYVDKKRSSDPEMIQGAWFIGNSEDEPLLMCDT